jgi:histidine triad (HIT) family protein
MENCIFCKIIKGEIPSTKVYEDDEFFAFLDISPSNIGHTLLIPKKHSDTFIETDDKVLENYLVTAKKVSIAVKKAVNADGLNIMINNDKAAGQIVFHTHLHIVPRFISDGYKHWGKKSYKEGEKEEIAEKIKSEIK